MAKIKKNSQAAFFTLLQAGLWEKECRLAACSPIDFEALRRLAEEQSVVGLIAAGLEHVTDMKAQKKDVLQFIGQTLQLEQRNQAMNNFIGTIVEKMRESGIDTLLVKGQGVAQCYERPLLRSCGDVDFVLNEKNYDRAKAFLAPMATSVDDEDERIKHLGMTIDSWVVELHGSLKNGLWGKADGVVDDVQGVVFNSGHVRTWMNGDIPVFLPGENEDVIFLFSHILQHFFKEGIGLRQICDWCRFMWVYREKIDRQLLEKRLGEMGVISEWKAFASLAVDYLGMPMEVIPFYSDSIRWKRKAKRIVSFVLETGNFGHNRDYSYQKKYPFVIMKAISLWKHIKDTSIYFFIFPLDSLKVMWSRVKLGVMVACKG